MREPVDWPTRDLVTHRVETTPDRTAVVTDDGAVWSYRDLHERVDAVAAALADHARGGRVAALVDTSAEVAVLLFGAMRAGVTLAPLNVELGTETLAAQVDALDPELFVCERRTAETATRAADCSVRSLDGGTVPSLGRDETGCEPAPLARDDTQLVLFTSGTTADPKGVRLTVGNLVASATASAFRLGVTPTDRWLACLPPYHMGGLAPFVRCALYGATVVVQRAFEPDETTQRMADEAVSGVSLVPTMLRRLLDDGWTPAESLRFVLLGGSSASQELLSRCERADVPVYPTYGMTETASQIATATPAQAFAHEGTVGQPLLFTEVTVVDDATACDPGERGELVVDGPTVTPGYLETERTEAAFGDHGFHTGDLGYRDGDGRLWVVGRVDDRIVTGGENVTASDVAGTIRDHPTVEAAAVVGLPDEEWGERVAAAVVGDLPATAVKAHCSERLASFEVPKEIRVVGSLPRTVSGTVDREAVRALFDD